MPETVEVGHMEEISNYLHTYKCDNIIIQTARRQSFYVESDNSTITDYMDEYIKGLGYFSALTGWA